jgi:hypothetical protein
MEYQICAIGAIFYVLGNRKLTQINADIFKSRAGTLALRSDRERGRWHSGAIASGDAGTINYQLFIDRELKSSHASTINYQLSTV